MHVLETLEQFKSKNTQRFYSNYLRRHTDQFKTPVDQLRGLERMFKESMLNFVIGIKNILYTSMVPFLVRECFDRILLIDYENKRRRFNIKFKAGNRMDSRLVEERFQQYLAEQTPEDMKDISDDSEDEFELQMLED